MTQYDSVICFLHPLNYLSCQSEGHIWIRLTQLMDYRDIFALASPSKMRQLECSNSTCPFFFLLDAQLLSLLSTPSRYNMNSQGLIWYHYLYVCSSLASSVESCLTNLPLGKLFKNMLPYIGRKAFLSVGFDWMFNGTCQISLFFLNAALKL